MEYMLTYCLFQAFAQLPHLKKHMLCVHNTDKPYYCEICQGFFKVCIVQGNQLNMAVFFLYLEKVTWPV